MGYIGVFVFLLIVVAGAIFFYLGPKGPKGGGTEDKG